MHTYTNQLEQAQDNRIIYEMISEICKIEDRDDYVGNKVVSDVINFLQDATKHGHVSFLYDDAKGYQFPIGWLYDIIIGEVVEEIHCSTKYKVSIEDCNDFDGNVHPNGGYIVELCKVCPGYFGDSLVENSEELITYEVANHPLIALLRCWLYVLNKVVS